MRYAVIIEKTEHGHFWAYVPDLPECTAIAGSAAAAHKEIAATLRLYIERLRANGALVPAPTSIAEYVEV